mmetsp:Transcript_19163/g.53385  ORF Transcript_19163/g.53385 Transcript_19163/m.53385 type:complete len:103 (-) Transcript_19163:116-424(-)
MSEKTTKNKKNRIHHFDFDGTNNDKADAKHNAKKNQQQQQKTWKDVRSKAWIDLNNYSFVPSFIHSQPKKLMKPTSTMKEFSSIFLETERIRQMPMQMQTQT